MKCPTQLEQNVHVHRYNGGLRISGSLARRHCGNDLLLMRTD